MSRFVILALVAALLGAAGGSYAFGGQFQLQRGAETADINSRISSGEMVR